MKRTATLLVAALLTLAAAPVTHAAEVKGFVTPAIRGALETLAPKFERNSGHKLIITFVPSGGIAKRLADGETADFVVSSRAGTEALVKDGKVVPGSEANVGKSGVGIAVRAGAPKPDISTPEALKRTLLAARAVSYSNPAAGGASGIHFAKVLERLWIAEEMKAKTRHPPTASPTAELVVKGEAEIAVQQFPELMAVPGVDIVGPLPGDLQNFTVFTAGVTANATNAEAAKAFIQFLKSEDAVAEIKKSGLEPG